jgi:hypothetical protein
MAEARDPPSSLLKAMINQNPPVVQILKSVPQVPTSDSAALQTKKLGTLFLATNLSRLVAFQI